MSVPRPHDRPIRIPEAPDDALETFTLRLPQWRIFALFRRSPLIRVSDRIEALVMVVAVMASLLVIPVAAAVGTAVYDARREIYAEQHLTRRLVPATITSSAAAPTVSRASSGVVAVQWFDAGAEHTGVIAAHKVTKLGEEVAVWLDDNGALTDEPTPTSQAAPDAVTFALFIWAGVTAVAAALWAGTRAVCDHARAGKWEHTIDILFGRDAGPRS
ncbi:hypothetical protein A5724_29575 [Mycobacterium sp. ACS1612]|uniref:Rv1733c family protein n=1 Tax=Mycobacterium sp. ACS1612 TaxID=1834117 RepID=UPI0007FF4620|nr:hypothetical protein [Mycobacterium sp. ACS1612]OBF27760.1 hypothetical protein A5724_29575 [Mycobacterium sp. ACS1612]